MFVVTNLEGATSAHAGAGASPAAADTGNMEIVSAAKSGRAIGYQCPTYSTHRYCPVLPQQRALSIRTRNGSIRHIDEAGLSPFRFQDWLGKRLTQSFRWHYDFDNQRFEAVSPIPEWLTPVRDRAEMFGNIEPGSLVQALVIRYDAGAGIGWHRDRPHFEYVVGSSLGNPAKLRFRRRVGERFERASIALEPRAAYHVSGPARHEWEHSLAAVEESRWSVTFRSLSDKGRLFASN